ncbi:hypothetical protein T08_16577, partial [Trichinella sp. T8]
LVTTNADENHSERLSEQNEAGEDFTSERLGTTPLPPRSWVHNDVPYYTLPLLSSPVALLKYGSGRYPGCTAAGLSNVFDFPAFQYEQIYSPLRSRAGERVVLLVIRYSRFLHFFIHKRILERNHNFAFDICGLYNWFSQRRESQYVRQSDHTNYRRSNGQSKPNQVLTPFIKTTN